MTMDIDNLKPFIEELKRCESYSWRYLFHIYEKILYEPTLLAYPTGACSIILPNAWIVGLLEAIFNTNVTTAATVLLPRCDNRLADEIQNFYHDFYHGDFSQYDRDEWIGLHNIDNYYMPTVVVFQKYFTDFIPSIKKYTGWSDDEVLAAKNKFVLWHP